ncbi:MAG TPA: DUF1080 domain-containing protein [Phycisphaerae bacterium]|nr:DUF1080 domain-containing protein [Phycisphaerae bacterium]
MPDRLLTRGAALLTAGLCLTLLLPLAAQTPTAPTPTDAITPKEPTLLFNGKDLTGWKIFQGVTAPVPATAPASQPAADAPKIWSVADGVLKLNTRKPGYLVTNQAYANYKLHVEWRWPKDAVTRTNSGVLLHVHGPPAIWPACYEAQLENGNAGQVVGQGLDIPDAPLQNKRKRAARFPGVTEKPFGEWNTYDIVAENNTLTLTINGVPANKVTNLPVNSGAIALQMEGYPIEFQNVRIEPIPETEP